jgi:hypothetical protein
MSYVAFQKKWRQVDEVPLAAIVISVEGPRIRLNAAALGLIDNPSRVTLLYDSTATRIALRPSDEHDPNSYKLCRIGNSHTRSLRVNSFFKEFKIPLRELRELLVSIDEGMLTFSISTPSTSAEEQ